MIIAEVERADRLRDGGNSNPLDGFGDSRGSHDAESAPAGRLGMENNIVSVVFELPELGGQRLVDASLTSFLGSNTAVGYNLDVVALKVDTDFRPRPADYEEGITKLGSANQVADNLATPSTPNGQLATISGGNLLSFLQGNYAAGSFVHLLFIPDALGTAPASQLPGGNYQISTPFDSTNPMQLKLTVVPEPATLMLGLLMSGAAFAARRRGVCGS